MRQIRIIQLISTLMILTQYTTFAYSQVTHDFSLFDQRLTLYISHAEVATQGPKGQNWDQASRPDPKIEVWARGHLIGESVVQDTFTPSWRLKLSGIPRALDWVDVIIRDADWGQDQLIEHIYVKLPEENQLDRPLLFRKGSIALYIRWTLDVESSIDILPEAVRATEREQGVSEGLTPQLSRRAPRKPPVNKLKLQQRSLQAKRLYQQYLIAHRANNKVNAYQLLLTLATGYPETRHGRKAHRLFLLNAQ